VDDASPVRVNLLHIGKTGGTALGHVLQQRDDVEFVYSGHNATIDQIPPGENVIVPLRDPVSRFVSGFNSRLRQGAPRYQVPWTPREERIFGWFPTPDALARSLSSLNPRTRRRARRAMSAIAHVRTHLWDYLVDRETVQRRRDDIVGVCFQERLQEDLDAMLERLGLAPRPLPTDEVVAHRSPAGENRELSSRGERNLRRWYREDYECLYYLETIGLCRLPPEILS
jgi:hypothetical protein